MANPLTAAQQTLSNSLTGEGWWTWMKGCPVIVRKSAWTADEWHEGVIDDGGDVVDLTLLAVDTVASHDGGVFVDFNNEALAGVLMQALKEATGTDKIKSGWTTSGWDFCHVAGATTTAQTGDAVHAEALANLLISVR